MQCGACQDADNYDYNSYNDNDSDSGMESVCKPVSSMRLELDGIIICSNRLHGDASADLGRHEWVLDRWNRRVRTSDLRYLHILARRGATKPTASASVGAYNWYSNWPCSYKCSDGTRFPTTPALANVKCMDVSGISLSYRKCDKI